MKTRMLLTMILCLFLISPCSTFAQEDEITTDDLIGGGSGETTDALRRKVETLEALVARLMACQDDPTTCSVPTGEELEEIPVSTAAYHRILESSGHKIWWQMALMMYQAAVSEYPTMDHHLWYEVEGSRNWFSPDLTMERQGDVHRVTVTCRYRRDTAQLPFRHRVDGVWYPHYRIYRATILVDANLTPLRVETIELIERCCH